LISGCLGLGGLSLIGPTRMPPNTSANLYRIPIIRASAALIFLPRDSYCSPIPQGIRPQQQ
jgi:hypothetical protein